MRILLPESFIQFRAHRDRHITCTRIKAGNSVNFVMMIMDNGDNHDSVWQK